MRGPGTGTGPRPVVLVALLGIVVAPASFSGGGRDQTPPPSESPTPDGSVSAINTASSRSTEGSGPHTLLDSASPTADLGVAKAFRDEMTDLGFELPKRSVEAIDFELIDPEGTFHKLSAYRGSIVFLNFWATWCVPCRTEMPAMQALHDKLAEEIPFRMIAINMQETPAAVQAFVDELELSFDILIDGSGKTGATYAARTLPISYVIGKDGAILARIIGIREWADPVYVDLFQRLAAI